MDGIAVTLRRAKHPLAKKAVRKAFKRFRHMGSELTPEQDEIIRREAIANGVVIDWEGVGVPFTPENAVAVFEAMPDFLDWVETESSSKENFALAVEADKAALGFTAPGTASTGSPTA